MKKFFSHYWILLSFSLLLLFILIVFLIIKYPLYSKAIEIDIKPKTIEIDNTLPISDVLGKSMIYSKINKNIQGYISINVVNPNDRKVSFFIVLSKKELDNLEIKENYVKVYLTDQNDKPIKGFEKNMVPSFADLKRYNNKSNDKILYKGVLDKKSELKFILRSWISDTYVISNNLEKFSYDISVVI